MAGGVQCEELAAYKTFGRALRLADDAVEVIVTLDVGPRIMHVSLPGRPNVFMDDCALREELPDGTVFEYLGGHRVWHSPEAFPRSYVSDSRPVEHYELHDDGVLVVQREEPWTHIVKSVDLRHQEGSVTVRSSLTNRGAWAADMAVWSLFLGAANGRLLLPVPQRDTGLLPNRHYVLWPYSRMEDPRVHWGNRFIVLDHDEADGEAFKFGYANELGWLAYAVNGSCLVKTFVHEQGAVYPDMGCSCEAYTAGWGIDIESLSPLQRVEPGATISHDERWHLFDCPQRPSTDQDEIARLLRPFAATAGFELPGPAGEGGWYPLRA